VKREAVHHSKMKRLCRKLNLELWQAVGLLESIWHVAARQTPCGDIGKLSDEDIAIAIDYHADERIMIDALVNSGWIDRNKEHRLVVHDWPDHAEDGVHMKVARARQFFIRQGPGDDAILEAPKLSRFFAREREPLREFYENVKIGKKTSKRAHGVRTDLETVRTDRQTVRTKSQSVAKTPPRPRLDPALTPPLTPNTADSSKSSFQPGVPSSSFREIGIALGLDDDAARKLIAKIAQTDETVTTREIIELGRMKKSQVRNGVSNWPGLLLTSIPKMAAGSPLELVRKNLNGHSKHIAEDAAQSRRLAQNTLDDPTATTEERKIANELLQRT
jgi:hypothetical protein